MVASDEMNFGKAYVTVEARLDEYERQMRNLEQAEVRSVQRVHEAQQQQGGGGGGLGFESGLILGHNRRRIMDLARSTSVWQETLGAVFGQLGRIRTVISRIFWPVALVVEGGRLVQMFRDLPQSAERFYNWVRQVSLREVVRDVHDYASQIPIIGHLWRGVAETVSQVSEGLGFANFTRDLREAAEAARVAENRLAGMAKAAQIVRDTRLIDTAEQSRRSRKLSGLTGADAIRQQELFNQEDLVVMARQAATAVHEKYTEQLQQLQGERSKGLIDPGQYEQQLAQLNIMLGRQLGAINNELLTAQREAGGAVAARLGEHAMQRAQELERLQQDLAQARVQLERDGFDAQAEAIRIGYQTAIMAADRDGEAQRSAMLREIARTRIEAVRRAEREAVEARVEEINEGGGRVADVVARMQAAVERGRLELSMPAGADRDRILNFFDIDTSAEGRIREVRQQIEQLQARQRELTAGYSTSANTMLEIKALGNKIEGHMRLLELLKDERDIQRDLVRQRQSERYGRGEGQQISSTEARNYLRNQRQTSPVGPPATTAEGQRQLAVIAEHADAIRKALDRGQLGIILR